MSDQKPNRAERRAARALAEKIMAMPDPKAALELIAVILATTDTLRITVDMIALRIKSPDAVRLQMRCGYLVIDQHLYEACEQAGVFEDRPGLTLTLRYRGLTDAAIFLAAFGVDITTGEPEINLEALRE